MSSVDQQTVQMGKEAFNLLMDIVNTKEGKTGENESAKVVLEPILCYRESSAGKRHKTNTVV